MPKTKITEELATQWVHLHQKGHSFRSIAKHYMVDPRTVQAWVQKAGEEREKQHWDAVSRQVDSKYLEEHYRLLLQTSVVLLDVVWADPVLTHEADPDRLLANHIGFVSYQADDIFKWRGLNLDVRSKPVLPPFEGREDRRTSLSRRLFDALMEHEPQMEKAINNWKENWTRFQQAQLDLTSAAKSLLEHTKVATDTAEGLKAQMIREVLDGKFLGTKQGESRINPQDGGKAEFIRFYSRVEGAVYGGSLDEMRAVARAYDKVLTQVSHQERLRPVVNAHRGLQESARTVEDMVERLILRGKPPGRCSLCPDFSI